MFDTTQSVDVMGDGSAAPISEEDTGFVAWIEENVPIVAGVAGGLVLCIIIAITAICISKRRGKDDDTFDSPYGARPAAATLSPSGRDLSGGAMDSGTEMNVEWLDEITDEEITDLSSE